MTDYCASADIVENMKGVIFGAASPPAAVTTSGLAGMIAQESAVIDQHIVPRYTLPVADATALLLLKKICIDLVVYRVTKVLQPKTAMPVPDDKQAQDISHVTAYREAMKMLKNIMEGKSALPGEGPKTISYFSSTAVNECDQTEFVAGERQW